MRPRNAPGATHIGRRALAAALAGAALLTACSTNSPRSAHIIDATVRAPTIAGNAVPSVPVAEADRLELVFSDTFDGTRLSDAWSMCYWWQVDGGCTIASNDEQQWYRPDGVEQANGVLRLVLSADEQRTTSGDDLPFRSGMVSTGHLDDRADAPGFAFTYGVVEARVRLPDAEGVWPAVWMLSADRTSLPEIDVLEWYGKRPTTVTSHVHQRIDGERVSARVETTTAEPLGGGWHDVAVDWNRDRVVFFLDGVETGRVDDPDLVPHTAMYLIVNLAAGGPAGAVDVAALPQEMLVDHVHVWQRRAP